MRLIDRIRGLFARQTSEPANPDERRIPYRSRTTAGIVVTPDTAITVPAVWACLRYLSQTVAVLPWHVMKGNDRGGGVIASSHPVDWLLWKRPNLEWSSMQFRETLLHWALRWGNGYAEIERNPAGVVVALWPLHPHRVRPMRDADTGRLFYRVSNGAAAFTDLDMMDVFHLRGFGEGVVGVNVMEYAAESIGWARAAQLFGAAFFGQGMNATGTVEGAGSLDDAGFLKLKKLFKQAYRGVLGEKVIFLDKGMKFTPISIEPEKAQFLGTNQYLVEEICRWFGVPPHKVAHMTRSTNNNVESQVTEVVVDSVSPWSTRFEQEADFKLFGQNRPGYYTKLNLNALMRGDPAARAAFYKAMREAAVFSADDILTLEDMPTIGAAKGGDKLIVNGAYTTLEKIGEAAPTPPAPPSPPTPPGEQAAIAGLVALEAELV